MLSQRLNRFTFAKVGFLKPVSLLISLTLLVSCSTASSIYPSLKSDGVYFQVPRSWHEISPAALARQEAKSTASGAAQRAAAVKWQIAYSPSPDISAADVFSIQPVTKPVVFVRVRSLNDYESNAVSLNTLRDVVVPLTSWIDGTSSIPIFTLSEDEPLTDKGGIGIHSQYTFGMSAETAQTLNQKVLLSNDRKTLYLFIARCSQSCFGQNRELLDKIAASFTVRGR